MVHNNDKGYFLLIHRNINENSTDFNCISKKYINFKNNNKMFFLLIYRYF